MDNSDLISREALKEFIYQYYDIDKVRGILNYIDNAPTVNIKDEIAGAYNEGYMCGNKEAEKERPQGEWIEVKVKRDLLYNTGIRYTCSNCKQGNCYGKPPFCMFCGAKMKGGVE